MKHEKIPAFETEAEFNRWYNRTYGNKILCASLIAAAAIFWFYVRH